MSSDAMHLNPIALAIPAFLLAMLAEWTVSRIRRRPVYRFADAITDLGCGVSSQAVGIVLKALTLGLYAWVYVHGSLVHFAPNSPWPWVLGIVGVDFIYYWWHRYSHEVNALWAAHVVHHQSEDYNLAVALRQAWFTGLTGIVFNLPLALLGVDPIAYATGEAISLLYQFWIHTELITTLGWFEAVFNTPAHHRVHHATNPQYLDKNYGGILILWDRLFGTFEPEREPCVFGITKPFGSFNPVWANLHAWYELLRMSRRRSGFGKLRVFFERPGWDPELRRVVLPRFVPREQFTKFDAPPMSLRLRWYVAVNFVAVSFGLMALLLAEHRLGFVKTAIAVASLVTATASWSGMIEKKRWAIPAEVTRIAATVGVLAAIVAV